MSMEYKNVRGGFRMIRAALSLVALCLALCLQAADKPFLHPLFNEHMVFPCDVKAPIWGWAAAGEKVSVSMGGQTVEAVAGADGRWEVKLGPFPAGGTYSLSVSGSSKKLKFNDLLTGDVWLCSGQSNMSFGMRFVQNSQEEIANAEHPQLRLFDIPAWLKRANGCKWTLCNPETVALGEHGYQQGGGFSAVAYFFGRDLQKSLGIPVGLVQTSIPGSPAEMWAGNEVLGRICDEEDARIDAWFKRNDPAAGSWSAADFKATDWESMELPQLWGKTGLRFEGVVWFRKEFDLPEAWAGKDLTLQLGLLDDRGTTWLNGEFLGNSVGNPSTFSVKAKTLKPGRNVIAVRVLNTAGDGGFAGKPEQMKLELADDAKQSISLVGAWSFKASRPMKEMEPPLTGLLERAEAAKGGSGYNNLIEPLAPFAFKGVIWYQGESNVNRIPSYNKLMPDMIAEWRALFDSQKLPFLMVQLPGLMINGHSDGTTWAEFREAQADLARNGKDIGLAVIIDRGDPKNIHPAAKQDVGGRLALKALSMVYGKDIESSGPVYGGMERKGAVLRIKFSHTGKGLVAKDGPLTGFSVAGADKVFQPAEAAIEDGVVSVSSAKVPEPLHVRYAWCDNPVCNLYNSEGLPAMPFRTDEP